MRLDRYDVVPFGVVILFGFLIPMAMWLGFATREQVLRDLRQMSTVLGLSIGSFLVAVMSLVFWWRSRELKRERQLLRERGEQTTSNFTELFNSSAERKVARLLYPRLQSFTVSRHMPLRQQDSLYDDPLWADEEDIEEFITQLCSELDVCPALKPGVQERLLNAKTVGQLVESLAELVQ
jgi:hypothetical protein